MKTGWSGLRVGGCLCVVLSGITAMSWADDGVLISGPRVQSEAKSPSPTASRSILVSDERSPAEPTGSADAAPDHPAANPSGTAASAGESETIKADLRALGNAETVQDPMRFKALQKKLEEDVIKEQIITHVVEYTKQNVDSESIISKIQSLHATYTMSDEEVKYLQQHGVDAHVIEAIRLSP